MRKFRSVSGPSRRWSQNRFAAELARGGPAVISLSQCSHCGIDLLRLSLAISLNSDTNIRLPELDFLWQWQLLPYRMNRLVSAALSQ
jgi:hypothetical protein